MTGKLERSQITKKELIRQYKEFYNRIRDFAKDNEIFPELNDNQFENFVSKKGWMGVPSFSITKKEMTNSDMGHIGIEFQGNNIVNFDLWFNGKKAVERLTNILKAASGVERKKFIDLIKSLDRRYKIRLLYTEKFYSASADWDTVFELRCKDLDENKIIEFLNKVKELKEKRDERQKILKGTPNIATIAVSVAEVDINRNNDIELEDTVSKLVELTRIAHSIKSTGQIKKITKKDLIKLPKEIEELRERIEKLPILINMRRATDEDLENFKKELKEKEEKLRELKEAS
jgi:hypothetical protein